jgi:hypothetical protein
LVRKSVSNYTLAGLGGISLTSLSGGTGITYNNTTGAISSTITQYTDALARASVSLTTTGTSGASTYNSTTGVFNIPQYQAVLTNPVTGTGTTNYVAKFTSSTGIGNSIMSESSTTITVGGTLISGGSSKFVKIGNEAGIFTNSTYFTDLVLLDSTVLLSRSDGLYTGAIFTYESASGDNVGIVSNGSIKMVVNGTANRGMIITSDGNVGIGSTSPSEKLEVQNGYLSTYHNVNLDGAGYGLQFYTNGGGSKNTIANILVGQVGTARSGDLIFSTSNNGAPTERMRITSTGELQFAASNAIRSSAASSYLALYGNGGGMYFGGSNANHMNLTGGGNLLIGTLTDNGERLYVIGAIRATGTITANSDISLKKNLLRIENALEKVEQINGYTYEFKEDDSKRHAGVIAQEIQTVLPEIVNKGNDGILGVEYGNISALLIEAIKEQNIKIKNLETLLASK